MGWNPNTLRKMLQQASWKKCTELRSSTVCIFMRVLLLNAAHSVLQNQCISLENRAILLLGRHSQLRCGPTLTVHDTLTAPAMLLNGSCVDALSHCLHQLQTVDSIVGCAFVVNDLLHDVSEKSKEFFMALRKYFNAKGNVDVERAMLDKANKMVFISMWSGTLKAETRAPNSFCMKSSILCHRVVYSESLLGPEEKDEKIGDDVQFMGTSSSAAKRVRRSRASDSEFSHIKSQDVDLRIWSGEGSLVHEFEVNFPAFNMPADDASSSGNLQHVLTSLQKSNTELQKDISAELQHCQKLTQQYEHEYSLRAVVPSSNGKRMTGDLDSGLRPS
jgi:hypothetical protein